MIKKGQEILAREGGVGSSLELVLKFAKSYIIDNLVLLSRKVHVAFENC